MRAFLGLSTIILLSAAAEAAPRRPATTPKLIAAQVNGEPVLRYGKETLSRPFGGTLVDRLDVVGAYPVTGGRAFLVRGTAAGPCPVQYVIVQAEGGFPRPSTPFGTCADGARARISRGTLQVTVPAAAPGAPPTRFAYSGGQVTQLGAPAAAVAMTSGAAAITPVDPVEAWAGPGGCASVGRGAAIGASEQLMANFDRNYPAEWRRRGKIEKLPLEPDQLLRVVTGLACLSTWPAADPLVPKAAVPLFASKRHGTLAFDLLEGIGRDANIPADLRAAARTFHAEMRFRVERREPI